MLKNSKSQINTWEWGTNGAGNVSIGEWSAIDNTTYTEIPALNSEEIEWVKQKIATEKALEKLAGENAAVKIALDQFKEAERKLKITAHLARTNV